MLRKDSSLPLFWKDIFELYFKWSYVNHEKVSTCQYVGKLGICFNSAFKSFEINTELKHYENLKKFNIFTIEEFLNSNMSLKNKINIGWFEMFDRIPVKILRNKKTADHPFKLLFEGKGSAKYFVKLFKEFKQCKNEKAIVTWKKDLEIEDLNWESICTKAKYIEDTRLRSFHIQFLNQAYLTNKTKATFSSEDEKCSQCHRVTDSYLHAYWLCPNVRATWNELIDMQAIADPDENDFTVENWMLSNFKNTLFVCLTSFCKRYIFTANIFKMKVHVKDFINKLRVFRNNHRKRCMVKRNLSWYYELWDILAEDDTFNECTT